MNYRPYTNPNQLPPINQGSYSYINNKETRNDLLFSRNIDTSLYRNNNAHVPTYFSEQYISNRKNADIVSNRENSNYFQFQRSSNGNSLVDFSKPIENSIGNEHIDYSKYIEEIPKTNNIKYFCPRCKSTDLLIIEEVMECQSCNAILKRPSQ